MKQSFHSVTVPTTGPGLYEFTDQARDFVRREKIENGLLTCFVRHTSASLLIQENADPDVQRGEERFAKQTQWSSGPLRATNAASLGERPGGFRRYELCIFSRKSA
ncbi:MAG TPA: YjbQ family protein [Rhizomicrobium sp.]|nr:YjbQ family protein [Rhizomicrobium sp.]